MLIAKPLSISRRYVEAEALPLKRADRFFHGASWPRTDALKILGMEWTQDSV
jgi:hypothetical protein